MSYPCNTEHDPRSKTRRRVNQKLIILCVMSCMQNNVGKETFSAMEFKKW